jgi:PAS domain S-box-containing protein
MPSQPSKPKIPPLDPASGETQCAFDAATVCFQPLFDAIPDGCLVTDKEGTILAANRSVTALLNTSQRSLVGRSLSRFVITEPDRPLLGGLDGVLEAGRAQTWEVTLQPRHETPIDVAVTVAPHRDAGGRLAGLLWFLRDVTECRRAERSLELLIRAGRALSLPLDHEATLVTVARLAIPHFADCCGVYLVGSDGRVRRLHIAHADPVRELFLHDLLEKHPLDLKATIGVPQVLKSGKSELMSEVPDSFLDRYGKDACHLGLVRECAFRTYMVVPLRARGQMLGAMTFCARETRRYGPEDLAVAEELAHRAALAIDSARRYRSAWKQE